MVSKSLFLVDLFAVLALAAVTAGVLWMVFFGVAADSSVTTGGAVESWVLDILGNTDMSR